jgi:hypothetical protein
VYGVGRIDGSGRVSDRAVTVALGWRNGDRLTITGTETAVIRSGRTASRISPIARPGRPASCLVFSNAHA